jgi:hypothetical protein
VLTGIPAEVRMIWSSVGENMRLWEAFANLNFAATRLGSGSERPSNILMENGKRLQQRRTAGWGHQM